MTWEKFEQKANAHFDPQAGNFAYLSLAGLYCYNYFKSAFIDYVDTDKTDSQAASGAGNTNYYDLMWKIEWYAGLVLWSTAAIFQLLATFGTAVDLNLLIWSIYVPYGLLVLEVTFVTLAYLAYNQFWDQS